MVAEKGSIVRAYGTQFTCFTGTKVQILTLEKRAGNSTAEQASQSPAFAAEGSEQRRERQSDAHIHTHIQRESDAEATNSSREHAVREVREVREVVQSHTGPVPLHSMQSMHSSVHSFKEAEENERQVTPRKDTGSKKKHPRESEIQEIREILRESRTHTVQNHLEKSTTTFFFSRTNTLREAQDTREKK
jgi:hypothetical protein